MFRPAVSFLITSLLLGSLSSQAASFTAGTPEALPFAYKIFRSVAVDLDKVLIKKGYKPVRCSYFDFDKNKQITYSDSVAGCLVGTFVDLMREHEALGHVQFVMKEKSGALVVGALTWRPTQKGWSGLWRELKFEYFEGVRITFNKILRRNTDHKPLPFEESLLGRATLDFETPPKLLSGWSQYDQVAFKIWPTDRLNSQAQFAGQVILSRKIKMTNDRRMVVSFSTNLNVIKPRRAFDIKGEAEQNDGQP